MPPRVRAIIPACVLVLATVAAYFPVFHAGFVWDDDQYVTRNPVLKQMEGMDGLAAIWIPRNTPQYYPVVFTAFWIEEHVYPDHDDRAHSKPAIGYHLVNLILHITNALLIVLVVRRIGVRRNIAWAMAFLFALHPMQVESVAWITERKNVLSTMFYFLAALSYLRFDRLREESPSEPDPSPNPRDGPWAWYVLAVLLFVLALLSKSVTASLPATLILALVFMRKRLTIGRVWPLVVMLALGAAAGLHTGYLEKYHVGAIGPDWAFTPADRLLIAARAVLFYPWKTLVPWPVMFNYPRWQIDSGSAWAYWPIPLLALLAGLGVFLWRRHGLRAPLLAAAFFLVTIFPALGFANVFPMRFSFVADHFQYLAVLGTLALVAGALAQCLRSPRAFRLSIGCIAIVFGILTFNHARHFESEKVLYQDAIANNPNAWLMQTNLARVYLDEAQAHLDRDDRAGVLDAADQAETHARRSIEARPDHYRAPWTLAEALRLQDRIEEAIEAQETSIELLEQELVYHTQHGYTNKIRWARSELAVDFSLLGRLYQIAERTEDAVNAYERGLAEHQRALGGENPGPVADRVMLLTLAALAQIKTEAGDLAGAAPYYERILRIHPDDLQSHLALAEQRRRESRYRAAREHLAIASNVVNNAAEEQIVLYRLAWLLATAKDDAVRNPTAAMQIAERLIVATGQTSPYIFDLLAIAYAGAGRFDDAVHMANEALILTEAHHLMELSQEVEMRKALYQQEKPYRE